MKTSEREAELQASISKGGANVQDYFDLGTIYLRSGRYDELLDLYLKMENEPLSAVELARLHHEKGEALLSSGRTDESIMSFTYSLQLLVSCEENYECLLWKGLGYYRLFLLSENEDARKSRAGRALDLLNSVLDMTTEDEDKIKMYSCIANIHFNIGDYHRALDVYNNALRLSRNPSDMTWTLSAIGAIYGRMNDVSAAVTYLRKALVVAGDMIPASKLYYDLAVVYFENNDLDNAREAFLEALRNKAYDPSLMNNTEYEISILWHLGRIFYETKDDARTIEYLLQVVRKIDKDHYYYANTNLTLAHYYLEKGDYLNAREHYMSVISAPRASDEDVKSAKKWLAQLPLNS